MPPVRSILVKYLMNREYGNLGYAECSTTPNNDAQAVAEEKSTIPVINKACELSGHSRSTFLVSFSPDRTKIASTHGDHTVRVTETKTGKCSHILRGHPRTPWSITFHPSSNEILSTGCLGGEVRIWDLRGGGSEVWKSEHGRVIASLAFHPTDQLLVIATNNELLFWDWSKPEPFARCKTATDYEKVRWCKFDPFGHYLYTGIANKSTIQSDELDNFGMVYLNSDPLDPDRRIMQENYGRIVNEIGRQQRDRLHSNRHSNDLDILEPQSPTHQEAVRDARNYAEHVTQQNYQHRQQQLQNARQYAASVSRSHSGQTAPRIEIGRVEGPTAPDLDDTEDHMQQIHRIPNVYAPRSGASSLETLARAAAAVSEMDTTQPSSSYDSVRVRERLSFSQPRSVVTSASHSSASSQQQLHAGSTITTPRSTSNLSIIQNTITDAQMVFQRMMSRLGRSAMETTTSHSNIESQVTQADIGTERQSGYEESSGQDTTTSNSTESTISQEVTSNLPSSLFGEEEPDLPSIDANQTVQSEELNIIENQTAEINNEVSTNGNNRLGLGNNLWQTFEGGSLNIEIPNVTPNSDDSNSLSGPLRTPRNSTDVDRPPLPLPGNVGLVHVIHPVSRLSNTASSSIVNYDYSSRGDLVTNEVNSYRATTDVESAFTEHRSLTRNHLNNVINNNSTLANTILANRSTTSSRDSTAVPTATHSSTQPPSPVTLSLHSPQTSTINSSISSSSQRFSGLTASTVPSSPTFSRRRLIPPIRRFHLPILSLNTDNSSGFGQTRNVPTTGGSTQQIPQRGRNLMRLLETPFSTSSSLQSASATRPTNIPQPVPPVTQTPLFQGRNSNLRTSITSSDHSNYTSPITRNTGFSFSSHNTSDACPDNCNICSNTGPFLSTVSPARPRLYTRNRLPGTSYSGRDYGNLPSISNTEASSNSNTRPIRPEEIVHIDSPVVPTTTTTTENPSSSTLIPSRQPQRLATIIESEVREAINRIQSRRLNISETIRDLNHLQRDLADIPIANTGEPSSSDPVPPMEETPRPVLNVTQSSNPEPTDETNPESIELNPQTINHTRSSVNTETWQQVSRTESQSNERSAADTRRGTHTGRLTEHRETWDNSSSSEQSNDGIQDTAGFLTISRSISNDLDERIERLDQRVSEIQSRLRERMQRMESSFSGNSRRLVQHQRMQERRQRMHRHLESLRRRNIERQRRFRRFGTARDSSRPEDEPDPTQSASRLRNLHDEIRNVRVELARRRERERRHWHTLYRRHLHHDYSQSIIDETVNRENDFQAAINRTIAGAFMANGEASIASNIVNLTHRVQRWDFSTGSIPDISDPSVNVVIPCCKLHNDATADISQDGKLLAMFVPSRRGFPDDTVLGVFSLEGPDVGKCLYTKSFGPNAISVSLSPLNNYVLVGLAAKRLQWVFAPKQMVAQIYKLKEQGAGEDSMEHICDLMHPCDLDLRVHVSVNSARWLPGVGEGVVYCTNRGDLHICKPGWEKNSTPLASDNPDERQHSYTRQLVMQLLRINSPRTNNSATQTTTQGVRRSASTQTESVNMSSDTDSD